ncbi:hypothetical protein FHETE_4129 [Fusarium heterosporum]|uniref:Uncharacterized protein n=1 Tax=Fusarium heterosporum TaxID=42747 RepID=A0A8H5WVB7_FUSHE|nr:hypothetical protein FHETE_4129 [Fusarium heterosporum]
MELSMSPAGDTVYPTHMIDNVSVVKSLVMAWTMRYNDVVDADKLHRALLELLEIGDWKKLGGRLKVGNNRRRALEIHVPSSFSKETPAVSFSHVSYDIRIEEHEIAKLLPKASDHPSIHPALNHELAISPDTPKSLKDFTSRDVPMLSLHVVSFQDATLVTISWPHVLFDAVGFSHLVEAWSSVLAGYRERVPTLIGARQDVLYDIGDLSHAKPQFKASEARILAGVALLFFIVRFIWTILTQPIVESRVICIPKDMAERLHQRALADIEGLKDNEEDRWVSPSDAILAWLSRTIFESTARPISMTTPIDARSRLTYLQDAKGVYVQNMILGSFVSLSPGVLGGSLGKQALTSRQGLLHQLDEPNLVGILQLFRKRWNSGKSRAPIFAAPGSVLLTTNSRLKVDIFTKADFSPAVLEMGENEARTNPLGTPVYHYAATINPSRAFRNFVTVHTKDPHGNYWLTAFLTPRQWLAIERDFDMARASTSRI